MLRGKYMRKYARILVAVTFLLGFSVAANAEIRGEVVVKLPFAFVASGVRLPAGTYTVKRFSQQPFDTLMLTSDNKRTSVFIHPAEMEDASDEKPKMSFHRVGEQHFLSAIETADYVYNCTVSRSLLLEAAAKQRDVVPASASGGSK
jgi:hypothetical protein